jgi:hypothetical protein
MMKRGYLLNRAVQVENGGYYALECTDVQHILPTIRQHSIGPRWDAVRPAAQRPQQRATGFPAVMHANATWLGAK